MTEGASTTSEVADAIGDTGASASSRTSWSCSRAPATPFDREIFQRGEVTPVFFGSAMTNFGVEPFLDHFVELAPPPRAAHDLGRHRWRPTTPTFSGFVFKIQANMDPQHRDRVAFVRVCSGRFERGMEVLHVRTGKTLALTRPLQFLAQERTMVDEAFAGRHHRPLGPGHPAHRRHAVRGRAGRVRGHPALLARSTSCACG